MTIPAQADQPATTVEPGRPDPAASRTRGRVRRRFRQTRVVRRGLGVTGFAFAVVFYCLALTPSLIPRSWLLQGVVSGLTAAMGYAAGAMIGALVRTVWRRRPPRATRIAWRVLFVVAPLLALLFLALGTRWQQELRARVEMSRMETYDIVRIVAVGVLTFIVLLLVARLLRLATRRLARLLGRFVPKPVAYAAGFLVVAYLLAGFVEDFLWSNTYTVLSQTASLTNGGTDSGIDQPASPLRSGSPESSVPWSSLGRPGRSFVATAPSRQELSSFAGRPATDPIRVYVGFDSAGSAAERAQLAVRELDRTGAFDRAVLGVFTATGTGWVDQNVTGALEYMYAGDTALVSMQYSYLPSWLSFMVDRSKVTETASALIAAVHAKWTTLPPRSRPKLVLFGESLGSYGTESAYPDVQGMPAERTVCCWSGRRSRIRSGAVSSTAVTRRVRCGVRSTATAMWSASRRPPPTCGQPPSRGPRWCTCRTRRPDRLVEPAAAGPAAGVAGAAARPRRVAGHELVSGSHFLADAGGPRVRHRAAGRSRPRLRLRRC